MAVNELERDWLRLLHHADMCENIMSNIKMEQEEDAEKKKNVGNLVMLLEAELLDDRWETAGKDTASLSARVATARAYWKA